MHQPCPAVRTATLRWYDGDPDASSGRTAHCGYPASTLRTVSEETSSELDADLHTRRVRLEIRGYVGGPSRRQQWETYGDHGESLDAHRLIEGSDVRLLAIEDDAEFDRLCCSFRSYDEHRALCEERLRRRANPHRAFEGALRIVDSSAPDAWRYVPRVIVGRYTRAFTPST